MDLLLVVSTPLCAPVLVPLAQACRRRGIRWGCFFTHDGVKLLADPALTELMPPADLAVACEYSWHRFMGSQRCPVTLGSQTNHSAMVAGAARVVGI